MDYEDSAVTWAGVVFKEMCKFLVMSSIRCSSMWVYSSYMNQNPNKMYYKHTHTVWKLKFVIDHRHISHQACGCLWSGRYYIQPTRVSHNFGYIVI